MRKMRYHQLELKKRAEELVAGSIKSQTTIAHITPGGGKSLAAAVFSRALLEAGLVRRVVWICPRTSLAKQAAETFRDPQFNPRYSARQADNVPPFYRDVFSGEICYTTTYQSIIAQPNIHRQALAPYKSLVILDEPHHLKDGGEDEDDIGVWVKPISPLVDNAAHVLMMTGTIERHDKKQIPFLEYIEEGGRTYPKKDIVYSRFDALLEEAIIPIHFDYTDGWADFEDDDGKHSIQIASATDKEVSKVIQTFLGKTEFRTNLLRRGLEHWTRHRKTVYPSRAIVVCATQKMAREVSEQIEQWYKGVQVVLAISDEGAEAQKAIRKFRRNEYGHVLVTVGMAYEGLDVPDCKHLICLTDTRSIPWLDQAFARVTRVDYNAISEGFNYKKQKAYIFVPDDPRMKNVVAHLEEEQDRGIKIKEAKQPDGTLEEEAEPEDKSEPGSTFIGLGARSGDSTTAMLDIEAFGDEGAKEIELAPADEKDLRREIEMLARRRDIRKQLPKGSTNKKLYEMFGPRSTMARTQLVKCLAYVASMHSRSV